jgi:hypothetical protein
MSKIVWMSLALLVSGCASMRAPTYGVLYTDVHAGEGVTESQSGNRVGEACAMSILGLVAIGDASIEAARRNGAVTMITSVDAHYYSLLGFVYSKYCAIVRGR